MPVEYVLIAICGFVLLPVGLLLLAAITGAYDD
jgi:hypothetical protein